MFYKGCNPKNTRVEFTNTNFMLILLTSTQYLEIIVFSSKTDCYASASVKDPFLHVLSGTLFSKDKYIFIQNNHHILKELKV